MGSGGDVRPSDATSASRNRPAGGAKGQYNYWVRLARCRLAWEEVGEGAERRLDGRDPRRVGDERRLICAACSRVVSREDFHMVRYSRSQVSSALVSPIWPCRVEAGGRRRTPGDALKSSCRSPGRTRSRSEGG